jgi:fatty acid/phospholipid biosynthesis enzyme
LLGVNGNVMIGHGGSSARAIQQLVASAHEMAREDVGAALARAMSS